MLSPKQMYTAAEVIALRDSGFFDQQRLTRRMEAIPAEKAALKISLAQAAVEYQAAKRQLLVFQLVIYLRSLGEDHQPQRQKANTQIKNINPKTTNHQTETWTPEGQEAK